MGRPKAFSEDDVMQGVADVFSAHGFKGTSMQMLVDTSGLGKQSLYNSFGDKQALYLKALDCATTRFGSVSQLMAQAPNGRSAVQLFFDQVLSQCASAEPTERACIVSSGLLEGVSERPIAQALRAKWAATHALLQGAIRRGQKDGSIAASDPADELAELLMTLMAGLRVSARAYTNPSALGKAVARVLALLDAPAREEQKAQKARKPHQRSS
jgi:TetR/AcrR family transcriptional repressor of nem operon